MNMTFDARHLRCPLPLIEGRKYLEKLMPNEALHVLCKDTSTVRDFESFCQMHPYQLSQIIQHSDYYEVVLMRL